MLYPVIICECGNKKVVNPMGKHIEEILVLKWCLNCGRREYWRDLSDDEARWE